MGLSHHSLKQDLTKAVLLWSASFFALLGILFLLSFQTLETYVLDLMAEHRLSDQTQEFAKHLHEKDTASIREESDALIQESFISAIIIVDTSGQLINVSMSPNQQLELHAPLNIDDLELLVSSQNNLHLYTRQIPGEQASLALVLDDHPIAIAILSATAWSVLLMLMLVMISIKALHFTLKRQLVEPVEHLRAAIADCNIDEQTIHKLEDELPKEASEILVFIDRIKHCRDGFRANVIDMLDALPSCFWWSDDGITYCNITNKASSLLQTTAEELTGKKLWAWCPSPAQVSVNSIKLAKAISERKERIDFAYQVNRHDKVTWFGESITICYGKNGTPDSIYGIINDISDRKNKQQKEAEQHELMHRMEATATLVGGIAHEFNNALAGMNGNLFLIKQNSDDKQTLNRIHRIEQLIERSAAMIDQMLSFARKNTLKPEPVKLVQFLKSFQTSILPGLPGRAQFNLQIDQSLKSSEPVILADQKRLHEMLLQLVQNADAAVKDIKIPHVSIELDQFTADKEFLRTHPQLASKEIIHIQVQDNGCGIAKDIQERIFEPFFTTREVGQGTGLGLSMVYGYTNQIGGAIDVESSPGKGSTFHIYLPAGKAVQELPEHKDTLLNGGGETILVVDDEQMFREATCEVLNRMGYITIPAQNGNMAIDLYEKNKDEVRLILMDIMMPGLTGIQTSRHIRKITPELPIIFLTAYDRTQPLEPDVYQNHSELINKPFHISALSQAIQKALRNNGSEKLS